MARKWNEIPNHEARGIMKESMMDWSKSDLTGFILNIASDNLVDSWKKDIANDEKSDEEHEARCTLEHELEKELTHAIVNTKVSTDTTGSIVHNMMKNITDVALSQVITNLKEEHNNEQH